MLQKGKFKYPRVDCIKLYTYTRRGNIRTGHVSLREAGLTGHVMRGEGARKRVSRVYTNDISCAECTRIVPTLYTLDRVEINDYIANAMVPNNCANSDQLNNRSLKD